MNKKKGFTIIELLAAVVIVGIILGLAILVINRYIIQGHETIDKQLGNQLALSGKSYHSDNKRMLVPSDGAIIWYSYLKANNYITNDLKDSNGNSCDKSYVVVTKERSKYKYTSCIVCNNGYNNTSDNEICVNAINSGIVCSFTPSEKITLGINSNSKNTQEYHLECSGKNIRFKQGSDFTNSMFKDTTGSGTIELIKSDTTQKKGSKNVFSADVLYTAKKHYDKDANITFNEGNIIDNKNNINPGISQEISIDGKGPSCELSGAYSDSKLTNAIKTAKGNSTVYYKLTCKDDNKINGTIKSDGFTTNNLVSKIEVKNSTTNGNQATAVVAVTTGNNDGTFTLEYKNNQIFDEYKNGNKQTNAKNSLTIDGAGPVCRFVGPKSNINLSYSKKSIDISPNQSLSDMYVYYGIVCTDTSGINENTFNIGNVKFNGFSGIKLEKTETITNTTKFIIKAMANRSLSPGSNAYLTFEPSTIKDTLGNPATGDKKSDNTTITDSSLVPKCEIKSSLASNKLSATLTGTITDTRGLTGYAWTANSATPSSYAYTSGTEQTVKKTIKENGVYYLHAKNNLGNDAYCLTYVNDIEEDNVTPACSINMTKTYTINGQTIEETYKSGYWTQRDVKISFECTDDNGIASQSMYESNNYLGYNSATISDEGIHEVTLTATDPSGNEFSHTVTIKIDRSMPVPTLECYGSSCTFTCEDENGISCMTYAIGKQSSNVTTNNACERGDNTNAGKTSLTFSIPRTYKNDKVTVVGECTDKARNGTTETLYDHDPWPSTVKCSLSIKNPNGKEIYSSSSQKLTISGKCSTDNSTMTNTWLSGGGCIDNYSNNATTATGVLNKGKSRTCTIELNGCDAKNSCDSVSRTITQTKK